MTLFQIAPYVFVGAPLIVTLAIGYGLGRWWRAEPEPDTESVEQAANIEAFEEYGGGWEHVWTPETFAARRTELRLVEPNNVIDFTAYRASHRRPTRFGGAA